MRYQYYYFVDATQALLDYLSEYKIKHQVYHYEYSFGLAEQKVKFSIYSSQANYGAF